MTESRENFIEKNRVTLSIYHRAASDKDRYVSGFGLNSPKDTLCRVLNCGNTSVLLFAMLHIFWDFREPQDREFVIDSLRSLSKNNCDSKISDPDAAYVLAYCLHQSDYVDKSADIINRLFEQCYPPALATTGDAHIAHLQMKQALDVYSHALDHGHFTMLGRRNKLIAKNSSFFKACICRIIWLFQGLFYMFRSIKNMKKMAFAGYLDFYGVKKYLDLFWELPKSKRIELLKKQPDKLEI